jgi:hypothetical protein
MKRSFVKTWSELTCLATSTGSRIGSFRTPVWNSIRSVTTDIAAKSWKGSMKGEPSRKERSPVSV